MICPICKLELSKNGNTYKCLNNHSFDISKEGYTNLLISKTNSGDNKESTKARYNFLNRGYYDELGMCIKKIINSYNSDLTILDCGCGIGYYDKFIESNHLYGLDISKDAIQKAAKLNKNVTYIVASSNSIPFKNNYFDLLIYIFAPIFINETKRVLKENGNIIIVTPGPDHLYELKEIMYKNPYHNDDRSNQFDNYKLSKQRLKYSKKLDNTSINDLIKMTPYNYKTNSKDIENISIDQLSVTFDFIINIYKPNN